jgi:hypothetical protein
MVFLSVPVSLEMARMLIPSIIIETICEAFSRGAV